MRSPLAAPLGALFLLAACSGQSQTTDQPAKTEAANDENKLPDTGSGDPIELAAIEKGEMLRLDGELGCAFTVKGQSAPAFVAKANVGDDQLAAGAVKVGSTVQRVAGSGGFGALEKGLEMSGPGLKLTLERASDKPVRTEGEQKIYEAKLNVNRTYGGQQAFEGEWSCGA
ncbi:hypothetical protein [Sphingopyxis indica]|uniref:Lipoprotein n=1 Tax=Sphingopyxis indica TaxID=436663 RepID=A0A239DH38_9SPHN|nr:hypothetical protein [Sphingopyxis indica]WOF44687.1 hypothetical protein KNJ79_07200 [Sphingopyxis indica]SNS31332.1 hypothetical protein SAMN06295955_101252 [Sphingopyxis indica]